MPSMAEAPTEPSNNLESQGIPVLRQPKRSINAAYAHAVALCKTETLVIFFPKARLTRLAAWPCLKSSRKGSVWSLQAGTFQADATKKTTSCSSCGNGVFAR